MSLEKLIKYHSLPNIAHELEDDELHRIGELVCKEFQIDVDSRKEKKDILDKALKIAKQTVEVKNEPWEKAANIKYPLIPNACNALAARSMALIHRDNKIAHFTVLGKDPDGSKAQKAKRLSDHLSYQLLVESDSWLADTDKLTLMIPMYGTVFRKTFYDTCERKPGFSIGTPDQIVVNDKISSLKTARRITHRYPMYRNEIIEKIREGIFCDIDLEKLRKAGDDGDEDPIFWVLEQHRYLDLDEDTYAEPYIVSVLEENREVLNIVARFDLEGITTVDATKEVKYIKPVEYFTAYHCLPAPDGGFHHLGLAQLLFHVNSTINGVFNILVNAGTLATSSTGFVSKGLKLKDKQIKAKLGVFTTIDSGNMEDLAKNFFQLKFTEPSPVLFQLLQLLIQSGKELASISDIMTGDQPAQNVPATTVMAMLDQSMKLYNSIQKRLYISLKQEFQKLVRINKLYLDSEEYFRLLDDELAVFADDYADMNLDVKPVADPHMSSEAQRLLKVQAITQFAQQYPQAQLNPAAVTEMVLTELQLDGAERLLEPVQSAPDPAMIKIQMDAATKAEDAKQSLLDKQIKIQQLVNDRDDKDKDRQLKSRELDIREKEMYINATEKAAKVEKDHADILIKHRQIDSDEKISKADRTSSDE